MSFLGGSLMQGMGRLFAGGTIGSILEKAGSAARLAGSYLFPAIGGFISPLLSGIKDHAQGTTQHGIQSFIDNAIIGRGIGKMFDKFGYNVPKQNMPGAAAYRTAMARTGSLPYYDGGGGNIRVQSGAAVGDGYARGMQQSMENRVIGGGGYHDGERPGGAQNVQMRDASRVMNEPANQRGGGGRYY